MPLTARRTPPPLAQGDRLTRGEFERRYAAMPENVKAELVEGVVHLASPVGMAHSRSHALLMIWLANYEQATPRTWCYDNTTVRLDMDNEPQPDACLLIDPSAGGQTRFEDGYVVGAPDLCVEVARSSASYDLGDKLKAYRRNGVREHVVWRLDDDALDWFLQDDGAFVPLPFEGGVGKSRAFPGLWLNVLGLLGDVRATLDQGLASPEHAAFLAALLERGADKATEAKQA